MTNIKTLHSSEVFSYVAVMSSGNMVSIYIYVSINILSKRLLANQQHFMLMSTMSSLNITQHEHKHKKKAYDCAYFTAVLTST